MPGSAAQRLGAELRRTDRSAKRSTDSNFQNAHDLGAAGVTSSAVLGGNSGIGVRVRLVLYSCLLDRNSGTGVPARL
jgi:hypothetical protein